jgi:transposase
VGWLATTMDKTALRRLVRINWDTTGRIIERVMATGLDPKHLDNLFVIGVDEVSCEGALLPHVGVEPRHGPVRLGPRARTPPRWTASSMDSGTQRCEEITAVSMDMGRSFDKSARKPGTQPKR